MSSISYTLGAIELNNYIAREVILNFPCDRSHGLSVMLITAVVYDYSESDYVCRLRMIADRPVKLQSSLCQERYLISSVIFSLVNSIL